MGKFQKKFQKGGDVLMSIGKRLRMIRVELGLNQTEFSSNVPGLKYSIVSRIELGQAKQIDIEILVGICEFLESKSISIRWFLLGKGWMNASEEGQAAIRETVMRLFGKQGDRI